MNHAQRLRHLDHKRLHKLALKLAKHERRAFSLIPLQHPSAAPPVIGPYMNPDEVEA